MVEFARQPFYRCVLPFSLIGGALFRPSFLSLIYVFLGFLGPAFPSIKKNAPLPCATRFYLIFCSLISLLTAILQLSYQALEYFSNTRESDYTFQCEDNLLTYWLMQCGFIRLPKITSSTEGIFDSLRIVGPEIVALLSSVITLAVCSSPTCDSPLTNDSLNTQHSEPISMQNERSPIAYAPLAPTKFSIALVSTMRRLSDVFLTFFIAFVGSIQPSLLNLVYFVVFLILMTWWALYTPLRRRTFNAIKCFLIFYFALHFTIIFVYQIPVFQEKIPPDSFVARLFGLTALVRTDCEHWWVLQLPTYYSWTGYVNFGILFCGYHVLLIQYAWTKAGVGVKIHNSEDDDDGSSVHEELLSGARNDESGCELLFPLQRITSEVLDRQKISDIFRGQRAKYSITVKGVQSFLYFCLYHCYVFALLAMLTWSLLYHSLFGLIFLVLSCFLWALHDSRKWTFKFSPVILIYAEFLLLAQYVYNMDLTDVLPDESYIRIIGFILPPNQTQAIITLGVKTLLSFPLFVLLRLSLREEFYNSLSDHDRLKRLTYGTFDTRAQPSTSRSPPPALQSQHVVADDSGAFEFISDFFINYWIFVVAILLLVNGVASPPVLYSLGFFVFFTILIVNLNISFSFFRRTTYLFLTLLIIYSSLVLIAVYSYQFSSVPELFRNITGLNKNWTDDIGLVYFDDLGNNVNSLFIRLILPISLIVVIMLQLKFFHDPWTKLIQTPTRRRTSSVEQQPTEDGADPVENVIRNVRTGTYAIIDAVWRLLEVHGYRIILFVMVLISVKHFCVLNFVVVIFVSLSLCFSSLMPLLSLLLCIYMSAVFIARRIYELNLIEPIVNITTPKDFNCPGFNVSETVAEFRYTSSWIGFEPADTETSHLTWDLNGLVLVIVLIGLQLCVRYRQRHRRILLGQPDPPPGIIFPDVPASSFDENLIACFKCFLNYGFYKFGLEISLGMMAAVAWIRMDLLGAIQILWALMFVKLPRSSCRRLWPIFVMYVAIMFPVQYAMAIGIPVEWCIEYPWSNLISPKLLNDNLLLFLDLASNRMSSERFYSYIIVDFLLLMVASAQMSVFWQESDSHPAGSNSSIYKNGEYVLHKDNPHYDFIVEQKSFVDFIKVVVFNYGHWITLVAVLAAGLGGTSIFAMGYLVLAFWMLWQGSNLYTMTKYSVTITKWKYLAYYTIVVMFFKVALQVFGCSLAYLPTEVGFGTFDLCTIEQVFSVICVNKYSIANVENVSHDRKCDAYVMAKINRETKIGFDMIAFIFILFQLRILNSWFFQRCVIEFRCEMIQAKRGAVLINQLIEKEMREQNEQQNNKFKEIKDRTAEIRKRYEAQQRRGSTTAFMPQTYGQAAHITALIAKRAGDYYMFEYDPNIDELIEPVRSFVPEVTPGASEFDKLDPAQLVYAAIQRDLDLTGTLNAVESAEKIKDEELRMIAAVAKTKKERDKALQILLHRQKKRVEEVEKLQQSLSSPSALETEPEKPTEKPATAEKQTAERQSVGSKKSGSSSNEDEGVVKFRHPVEFADSNEEAAALDSSPTGGCKSWGWFFYWYSPAYLSQAILVYNLGETIISVVQFIWKMFLAMIGWVAAFLNRRSREHRYVSYVLNKEKERLKVIMNNELYDEKKTAADLRRQWESINVHMVTSEADIRRLEDEAHTRWEERNVFARLMTAFGNCFSAHTDVLCFFMAAVAHAMCAGLITLPLPLIVFFWGALANPRPSKIFWVCTIGYTEFVIGTKFIFQFLFWPWNQPSATVKSVASPYPLNYVLGVQKVDYFAVYDVALLILLFFHRYMMRRLGLWKDANVQDTFSASQIESERRTSPPETSTRTTSLDPIEKERKESSAIAIDDLQKPDDEVIDLESGLRKRSSDMEMRPSTSASIVNQSESQLEAYEMTTPKADADAMSTAAQSEKKEKERGALYVFVYKLLYPKFRYIRDLYPLMFFLDVLCFMIVVFGYSSFGEGGSGDVINDIRANRVPLTFVLMLIIISLMIVIDRGLYLRKAVIWKLVYQILVIICLHVWIFGVLPSFTQEPAYKNKVPLYLYIIKCIYFLISAWQIRNGYPPLCIGNLLTHSYGLINMVLFKVFMAVPFLFELRTAIDWTWTDTSMPLFDFFNMENFYGVIYNLKCARTFEQSFPAPRGEPKGKVVKYLMGLPMILVLILVIWCPLLVFSMLNHVGMVANPDFVKLSVSIEGYPPIYSMEAQGVDVEEARPAEITDLMNKIASNDAIARFGVDASRQAISFVKEYQDQGILNVSFRPESQVMWPISKESLDALKSQLLVNQTQQKMKMKVHLEFQRPRLDKTKEPTIHSNVILVDLTNETRLAFSAAIDRHKDEVVIPFALPMCVVVPNEGEVTPAAAVQRLAFYNISDDSAIPPIRFSYNNLRLRLVGQESGNSYWIAQLDINQNIAESGFHFNERNITYGTDRSLKYVQLVAFVDRVFPTYLTTFVQGGIIAMYVAVVLLVGRMIRGIITSTPLDVIISEIPNPDYLLKICLDIYLVREARDFVLEQDLFAKLIFLFRSPATLIKWTRYKLKSE